MTSQHVFTLPPVGDTGAEMEPLRDQIQKGLLGTDTPTVPGSTAEDQKWAYKRSVPTLVLYDEAGLRLYDQITAKAPEYYLFEDELNLFKTRGHEIARAMGFPGRASDNKNSSTLRGGAKTKHDESHQHPPSKPWKPARWGDTEVGKWNDGVNGEEGLASGWERGWDVVELGAGALRKTAHLLTALADNLPTPPADASDAPPPIAYHALDLSKPELDRVLGQMEESYGEVLNGRVSCVGLHGDYFAGLQFVRDGGLTNLTPDTHTPPLPSSPDAPSVDAPASPESTFLITPAGETTSLPDVADDDVPRISPLGESMADPAAKAQHHDVIHPSAPASDGASSAGSDSRRPLHIIFLGSSLGNFDRKEAGPFLRSLPLQPGDTLLLGLDGRPAPGPDGKKKVEVAYNDPSGHTRAFEEHGWEVARKELGLESDGGKGVEFVGRYNEILGRHEAYFRSKTQQTLPLPSGDKVELADGELLHIEWSHKYSYYEATSMFEEADLNVINSWKAPDSEYRLWLLERPAVRFTEPPAAKEPETAMSLPRGVPTWKEWQSMWSLWDHITLSMIPPEMLCTKPIDLRHICLFYLGHIPTFLDIYLSRITDGTHTHPTFKDIFERGIDPDVDDPSKIHAHSEVPAREEDWPSLDEILAFRDAVRQRLEGVYDEIAHNNGVVSRRTARTLFMTYEHEAMHAETLLYMLLQSPLTRNPCPVPQWDVLCAEWADLWSSALAAGANVRTIDVRATTVTLGHDDLEADDDADATATHEFGWDNEHPRHAVTTKAFRAQALPITNGEYLSYLVQTKNTTTPASWVEDDGEFCVRTLFGPVSFKYAAHWPVMASRDELAAFAHSKGGRLPTEAELRALWEHPDGPRPAHHAANIGFKHWHPVPPMRTAKDSSGAVVHGHNGGVWEWTSSEFTPYDGFVPSELYPGYSADFFDGKHFVVLGGSYATVPQIARRKSFRNWYQGNYRYAWIGGRVVYDA